MNLIQTVKRSFWVFWFHFLHVSMKTKEKKRPCLHVQIQTACSISALSCLFSPLCKTGISKDKLVPRQSVATTGGAPTCRHRIHTQQKVVVTFITTITRIRTGFTRALLIAPCKAAPIKWKAIRWVTDSFNNENASAKCGRRNRKEERKKQAWGMSKPKAFFFFTHF